LLSGELRLLKDAIGLISGRLELLLSEIADLQLEHEPTKEQFATQIQSDVRGQAQAAEKPETPHDPETADAALLPSAPPEVNASTQEIHAAVSVAHERTAPEATGVADAVAAIDTIDDVSVSRRLQSFDRHGSGRGTYAFPVDGCGVC
jgi:hypothetical protein